jgi:uncharacterized OB-fold protein
VSDPQVTVDPELFAGTDPVRLQGGRCTECGTVVFPRQDGCPRCSHRPLDPTPLAPQGTVWSWTVQQFAPKPPFHPSGRPWTPLALGYVDLGEVIVEGWLVPSDRAWSIGDRVRVTLVPAWTDERGVVHTFAFEYDGSTDESGARA